VCGYWFVEAFDGQEELISSVLLVVDFWGFVLESTGDRLID
jgi:hypothetical protein